MEYYQILRNLREDKDLTQEEIKDYLYISASTYRNYENGRREMPFTLVVKLAQKYGVSLDYIAGITSDKGGTHQNSEEEQYIINIYKNLTDKNKGKAELFIEQLTENQKEQESKAKEKVS